MRELTHDPTSQRAWARSSLFSTADDDPEAKKSAQEAAPAKLNEKTPAKRKGSSRLHTPEMTMVQAPVPLDTEEVAGPTSRGDNKPC